MWDIPILIFAYVFFWGPSLRSENDAAAVQRARENQTGLFCDMWTGTKGSAPLTSAWSSPSFQNSPASETGNLPIAFPSVISSHGLWSHPSAQPVRQPPPSSSQAQGHAVSRPPDAFPSTNLNISNADPQVQERLGM